MNYTNIIKQQINEASITDLELMLNTGGATEEDKDDMAYRVYEIEDEIESRISALKQKLGIE